jgi:hypothetical protein
MTSSETWDLIERKMLELRILTNANWKNQEYELAVMGEKVLRSVEASKCQTESVRLGLSQFIDEVKEQVTV